MGKATLIFKKYQVVKPEKFAISVKVFEVSDDPSHPEGVKTSFVLIDLKIQKPVLLIDNHAPFGFHMHTELPDNKSARKSLKVKTYQEAYRVFMAEVEKRIEKAKD